MLTTKQIITRYGNPGDESKLVYVDSPFPLKLSWELTTVVTKIRFHKLAAPSLLGFLNDILNYYGLDKISDLHIDHYGGTYVNRNKRNGTSPSTHAFGIAIDLDPVRNQLRETAKTARFARPEYKPMIDAAYDNSMLSLGREKNYDWMHFEMAK